MEINRKLSCNTVALFVSSIFYQELQFKLKTFLNIFLKTIINITVLKVINTYLPIAN